jgi:hypothetical protein
MKQLTSAAGVFGPFSNIETLDDRYRCDGADYQFSVIGDATIEDYVAPPPAPVVVPVPSEITMRQARLALLGAGKLAAVAAAIAAMPEPTKSAATIEWEYSNTVQRHNGFVEQLGPAIGLTETQIDDLFIAAAAL